MLCCFFNSLNGILVVLGLIGIETGSSFLNNNYFVFGLIILNLMLLIYFTIETWKKNLKKEYLAFMFLGFFLTNLFNVVQIFKNKSSNCYYCPNKKNEDCDLACKKNMNKSKNINLISDNSEGKICKKICKNKRNKSLDIKYLILKILHFVGIFVTFTSLFFYQKSKKKCCKVKSNSCCPNKE